ncbi:MAG: helix-turn-helix domain-containing protein [Dehalococcoidia bacterium]
MADSPSPGPSWLTLGAASQLLGVSESTIRRWADAGELRSYRTTGGHRRVLEEDLRHLISNTAPAPGRDSDRISDLAIARVKRRLGRGRRQHSMAAFEGLAPEVLDRLRLMGRQLVDLFARYIASDTKGERFSEDARTIGHEYGRTLVGSGVGLTTAVVTFNTMRGSLEETAAQIATEAGLATEDAVEAIEHVLRLADTVLEGMAQVYERGG